MRVGRIYPLIFSLLLLTSTTYGQVCSIDLGPNVTICQGQTATFTAPPGFPNYLWSTGSTAASITVGTAGTYWGEVSYPTGELAINGNFSGGNTGFTTQFNYSNVLTTDGNYFIGNNAATYHPQFQGTGNGAFLMVNAGWMHSGWEAWCQTVTVCPGQTYTLRVRAMSLASAGPPLLDWAVDGVQLNNFMQTGTIGAWTTFTTLWTSAPGQTSASLCIRVASGHGIGNDFGLDDISISSMIVLRDQVDLFVTPLPVVDLGPDATLCAGQNLVLDAAVPGGTYLWQDGNTAGSYVVSGPGNYSVTVTANGCSATDAINVNYNPLPVVNLGLDRTLCVGQNLLLDVTRPGATYVWQNGSTASTFNVTGPGTYSVSVTVNGCTTNDAVNIGYNPLPVVDLGADQIVCAGTVVVLDATVPGATYLWQNGSTAATFAAATSGAYSVVVTLNGCTANDLVNIAFTPLPVVNLGPDQTVCPGVSVVLDATLPGGSYLWQDGSTAATFNASTSGAYSVQVTVNGCSSSDSFTLSNFGLQVVDLGPDITFCQGGSANIGTTVAGATYLWSTGASTAAINVSTPGIRWVDVTLNSCVVRDSIEVFVTPLPVVSLGPDRTTCPGIAVVLDATTAGATYLWNTGAMTPTINALAGAYDVTVTVNGCSSTDVIAIGAWPAAQVDLGNDTTLCPGAQLVLSAAQPGASYSWQNGSLLPTFTVTAAGTYSVDLTDANGCLASDAINVSYAAPGAVDLGPDVTICQGTPIVLDATLPGATYLWSTGAMTPTISPSTTGNYSVVVTQGTCTVNDAINITVAALPTVALGNDTTLCPGQQLVLNATGPGLTYAWTGGSTVATLNVSAGGNYSVTVTNAANCTATDAILVSYASPSSVNLGPDVTLCQGQNIVFDATLPGASYLWSNGATSPTLTANTSGQYWVRVSQGNCNVRDTVQVTVNPVPVANLGPDVTLCAGENVVLDATWPGASYLWSTGAITPTITASATGNYSVDVTLNGCTASDAVAVTVLSANAVDLGPDVTLCSGEQVVFDATTPGSTYLWSTGAITPTLTATTSGTVWVQVSTGLCSVRDTVQVTADPMPITNLGPDVTLCAGENMVLDATWPGATYLWSTGAIAPTITASATGNYSVDVTLNGCTASDAVAVTVLSANAVDLGPDVTLCSGEQVVFDATTPGSNYLWSTGAITPTLTATTSGTVWVQVSTGLCSVRDTVQVTVNPMPITNLGPDVTLCAGEDVVLDATWPGATYLWSTGAIAPTITASATGNYSVDVTLNGCTASDAVAVTVLSANAVDLGPDVTLCAGDQVVFDATTPGSNYLWSTGAITPTLTATTSGTVWVQVSTGSCSVSDTVVVNVNPSPLVDLGIDVVLCEGETSHLLDATTPGATYLWNTGETTPTLEVFADGIYSVDVDLNGCTASGSVTVAFGSMAIDLGQDTTLCPGQSLLLQGPTSSGTTNWNDVASGNTFNVTTPGTFWVVFVGGSGCSATDTISVDFAQTGTLDLGPDMSLCEGQSHLLDATLPGATAVWENGTTNPIRTVSATGTYSVVATIGQCSLTDEVEVIFHPLPLVDIGTDQALCPGTSALFDATLADASYLWQDGSVAPTYSATEAGPVAVTVTVSGCNSMDEALVTMLAGPQADLGANTTLCLGDDLELDVTQPGATYLWENGAVIGDRVVSVAGEYWVEVMMNGCVARDTITVSIFSPNDLDLGPDQQICSGATTMLDATVQSAQYVWSTGATTPTISVGAAGTYSVIITVAGCTTQDDVTIDVMDVPVPDLGPDVTICEGSTVELEVMVTSGTISWSTGGTGTSITVSTPGLVTVTVLDQGCTASDQIMITTRELVTDIDLGDERSLCAGAFDVLEATDIPGATYVWNTGAIGRSISIDAPGTYSVIATGDCIDAEASVLVVPGDCGTYVFVPNSFSPNGDGINDVFAPSLAGPVDVYQLDIFDRWGERIMSTTDRSAAWDGSFNGVISQDGVYVWSIHYRVSTPKGVKAEKLIGHVTLIR